MVPLDLEVPVSYNELQTFGNLKSVRKILYLSTESHIRHQWLIRCFRSWHVLKIIGLKIK